jgi:uncharacterized membrane protein
MPVDHPLYVLAVLGLLLATSEWCVRHTVLRHLGSALLVILLTAVAVNLRLIPVAGQMGSPRVYDVLLGPVAKVAIFWLLLGVSLAELRRAGKTLVLAFLIGALGTLLGVVIAMNWVIDRSVFGEHAAGIGAMFVGTYTGGSVNLQAMASEYGVQAEGALYLASVAVDNVMTAVWMAVTLVMPRLLRGRRPGSAGPLTGEDDDTESLHPMDLGLLVALGGGAVWASERAAAWMGVPQVLILTSLALLLAQIPVVRSLRGRRVLGMTGVYLFLAAIGALCDVRVLIEASEIAGTVALMVVVVFTVHGVLVFGAGRALRLPPDVVAVASQANVGGGTSALALARSLGRADLVLPAILVGALGTALGNFLGVLAATWIG